MLRKLLDGCGIAIAAILVSLSLVPAAQAQSEQQVLIKKAQDTFDNFVRDPDMAWIQKNLPRAKGVLITPEIVKVGFILGGSGGRGLLLAREGATNEWRGPAFYTLATGSIGFQAGVSSSENVTLVMTEKGLNALLSSQMKMGGDASVAAGPVGGAAAGSVTGDMVSFSRSKGVYGGLNLDGTVIKVNEEWNTGYYGKGATPPDILVRGSVKNPEANPLIYAVKAAGSSK